MPTLESSEWLNIWAKNLDEWHPKPNERFLLHLMNTVVYDPADAVFEFATDFHTPGRLKIRNLKFQPVFMELVICYIQFLCVVMLGSVIFGSFEAPCTYGKCTAWGKLVTEPYPKLFVSDLQLGWHVSGVLHFTDSVKPTIFSLTPCPSEHSSRE